MVDFVVKVPYSSEIRSFIEKIKAGYTVENSNYIFDSIKMLIFEILMWILVLLGRFLLGVKIFIWYEICLDVLWIINLLDL